MNEKENLHYELTISVFKESFFMISERIIYTNILFNDDMRTVLCAYCQSLSSFFILRSILTGFKFNALLFIYCACGTDMSFYVQNITPLQSQNLSTEDFVVSRSALCVFCWYYQLPSVANPAIVDDGFEQVHQG